MNKKSIRAIEVRKSIKIVAYNINKLKSNKSRPKNIQTHPQAFYTSRLLNFKNLPKPVNSSDLSSFQTTNKSGNI